MTTDCHVHLDDKEMDRFVSMMPNFERLHRLVVFANSVDAKSSRMNLELANSITNVLAFVGIHPEIFSRPEYSSVSRYELDNQVEEIAMFAATASGIGEVGVDPKYGQIQSQEYLFEKQLDIARSHPIPISIHSRDSVSRILELLSTCNLSNNILFHWFAGTEEEIRSVHERGYFTSFGPSIIYSKRMERLVRQCNPEFLMAETDAPTRFGPINGEMPSTPFLVVSVLFKMALILEKPFSAVVEMNDANASRYAGKKNSLRDVSQ